MTTHPDLATALSAEGDLYRHFAPIVADQFDLDTSQMFWSGHPVRSTAAAAARCALPLTTLAAGIWTIISWLPITALPAVVAAPTAISLLVLLTAAAGAAGQVVSASILGPNVDRAHQLCALAARSVVAGTKLTAVEQALKQQAARTVR